MICCTFISDFVVKQIVLGQHFRSFIVPKFIIQYLSICIYNQINPIIIIHLIIISAFVFAHITCSLLYELVFIKGEQSLYSFILVNEKLSFLEMKPVMLKYLKFRVKKQLNNCNFPNYVHKLWEWLCYSTKWYRMQLHALYYDKEQTISIDWEYNI